jgi:PAS domain S-box-containing protein
LPAVATINRIVRGVRPNSAAACAISVGAVAVGAAIGSLTLGVWPQMMLVTLQVGILFGAFAGGLWPGVLAAVLGTLATGFIGPPPQLAAGPDAMGARLAFLVMGLIHATVMATLRVALMRAHSLFQTQAATFDANPDAILLVDVDGQITDANARAAALFALPRQELIGHPVASLLPEHLRAGHAVDFAAFMARPARRQMAPGVELTGHAFDGGRFPIDVHIGPVKDDGPPKAIAIVRDLTQQKELSRRLEESERQRLVLEERARAGEVLRLSEERLRLALEAAQAGIWQRRLDSNDVMMSDSLLALRGLPPGGPFTFDEFIDSVYPEDRACVNNAVRRTVETNEPFMVEYRCVLPDGSIRWLQSRGELTTVEGERCLLGIAQDVTDRKRVEEEARSNRARLESALASMTDAVFVCDTEGRFVLFNDAFVTYHRFPNRAACLTTLTDYQDILEAFAPNGEPVPMEFWAVPRALRGETAIDQEYRLRRKDTGETWLGSYNFAPIRDEAGAIVGSVVVGRDITKQRETEIALRQSQKMEAVGTIAGGMAHDFNNLLSVIMLNLSFLTHHLTLTPPLTRMIEDSLDAARRGAELTQSLLAFARRQPLRPAIVDVNGCVTTMTNLFSRVLGESIVISKTLAGDLWPVVCDRSRLEAALMNLATNARDAMPSGGSLTLSTANRRFDAPVAGVGVTTLAAGDYVEIAVTDTGTGMTPEVLEKAFDPFFTTKDVGRGTGLGLSSVLGFSHQSDGGTLVRSTPGRGTTISLLLPRARPKDPAEAGTVTEAPRMPHGHKESVLVVEDNDAMRRAVVRHLTDLGYQAASVRTAPEALSHLAAVPVDLVLSDIVMPEGMTGIELAEQVRTRWPSVRLILTSGFAGGEVAMPDVLKEVPMLRKPYDVADLARILRSTLLTPSALGFAHKSP